MQFQGNNSRPPRSIFGSLNKSIGRTVKRSSWLSRVFPQSEGGNSEAVPRFRGEGPTFQPSAASSDAIRGTGHTLDDVSLNFPSEHPDSSPSEPLNHSLRETGKTDLKSRIKNSASEKGAVKHSASTPVRSFRAFSSWSRSALCLVIQHLLEYGLTN